MNYKKYIAEKLNIGIQDKKFEIIRHLRLFFDINNDYFSDITDEQKFIIMNIQSMMTYIDTHEFYELLRIIKDNMSIIIPEYYERFHGEVRSLN